MSADPKSPTTAPAEPPSGVAARAAHWSAEHRKLAIWGWIVFVVIAVMAGNAVGKDEIHGADAFTGEAADAEQVLYDAGMRPNDEVVIVQSESLTIEDPEFRGHGRTGGRGAVRGPVRGERRVAAGRQGIGVRGRRTVLIDFEITGDDLEARDRLEPAEDAVAVVAADHPDLLVEQFGNVSANKELNDTFTSDLGAGGADLASADAVDPGDRLRLAGGGRRTAAARDLLRDGGAGAGRASRARSPRSTATSSR